MYWNGQGAKGWGGGQGDHWGGGKGKGDPWGGKAKGDHWGGGKGNAWGGAWSGGKGDAWAGGKGDHWGDQWGGGDTWDSTGYGDPWLDNPAWDGGRGGGKNKKEKNYQSCTYLGCGRHRLPHEDRCTLAGLTLDLIAEDTGVQIPTMAVAAWREKTCNSFFYLLANAQPSTRLQQMVPRGQKFTLEAAAEGLIQMWKVLIKDPDKRVEQASQMLQWCVEDQEKMVAEAMKTGMEEHAEAGPGAPLSGSSVAARPHNTGTPHSTGTRALVRSDTNEEYERVKKKKETWVMKVELAEMQQKMAASSHGSAEAPQEHKEQAMAKEEKGAEADVSAAVSVITKALQQHAISSGSVQPSPSPAAAGAANLAAILRSAEAHFAKATVPGHAPGSGTPQPKAPATGAPTDLSTEAKRQRLLMLRGEVAAKRKAQEAAEKAKHQENIVVEFLAAKEKEMRRTEEAAVVEFLAAKEKERIALHTQEVAAAEAAAREARATRRAKEQAAAEEVAAEEARAAHRAKAEAAAAEAAAEKARAAHRAEAEAAAAEAAAEKARAAHRAEAEAAAAEAAAEKARAAHRAEELVAAAEVVAEEARAARRTEAEAAAAEAAAAQARSIRRAEELAAAESGLATASGADGAATEAAGAATASRAAAGEEAAAEQARSIRIAEELAAAESGLATASGADGAATEAAGAATASRAAAGEEAAAEQARSIRIAEELAAAESRIVTASGAAAAAAEAAGAATTSRAAAEEEAAAENGDRVAQTEVDANATIVETAEKDAIMAQTEEDELAELEAELESPGTTPLQQNEQTANASGAAASEPNMASSPGRGDISSAWTEAEEDEMQQLLREHQSDDSPAKRVRLT